MRKNSQFFKNELRKKSFGSNMTAEICELECLQDPILEKGCISSSYGLGHGSFWHEFRHAQQIISRSYKPGGQVRATNSFIPSFAESPDGLHPPKDLFYSLSNPLTHTIARMPDRPPINRRPPSSLHIGSYMGGNLAAPQQGHKTSRIIPLISSQGPRSDSLARLPLQHGLRRFHLGSPRRQSHAKINQKPVAVLHQNVRSIRKFRFLALAFPHQPALRVRRRLVGLIAPLLSVKIDRRVSPFPIRRPIRRIFFFRSKTLQTGPGFDQAAIDREVVVTHQIGLPGTANNRAG